MAEFRGTPPKPPGRPLAPRPEIRPKKAPVAKGPQTAELDEPAAPPEADTIEPARERLPEGERRADQKPSPRARVGDESVGAKQLGEMSVFNAAEHCMILLSKKRQTTARRTLLEEIGDLLLEHPRPDQVKKILMAMNDAGKIVDIYPLEVMWYVLERDGSLLDGFKFGELIRNKKELDAYFFDVEQPIRLELPLSAKLKAMALEGGGFPGYHLYPGALTEYFVEFGDSGLFTILLRAEIHREMVLDKVTVEVKDSLS